VCLRPLHREIEHNLVEMLKRTVLLSVGLGLWSAMATLSAHDLPTSEVDEPKPAVVKGKVVDSQTGEEIVGAIVYVKDHKEKRAVTGLDGSFALGVDDETATLVYSCLGYQTGEYDFSATSASSEDLTLPITEKSTNLGEAVVRAHNPGRTEVGARAMERGAMNVINVMSAKAIELSPDITVANALGRISGITMERSASGEGQYAILRGMDKRYNYTLVNGVKIPSPDNKNRFVPLDIFPAEMLDRLEVTKSLTADLEGDGIGGAVNMVMKDAPESRQFTFNATMGYSALYFERSFATFPTGDIQGKSPNERNNDTYKPQLADFTSQNLRQSRHKFVPDFTLGTSYGDRFFNNHLGVMLALSAQNIHRGKNSDIYAEEGLSTVDSISTHRTYSEQQTRLGAHLKLDYKLSEQHDFAFYGGYMFFRNQQVRDNGAEREENVRLRLNKQNIFNSTLMGTHRFLEDDALKISWRGVYSKATNKTPDNVEVNLNTYSTGVQTVKTNGAMTRRWEHNSDEDIAGYVDGDWRIDVGKGVMNLKAGGMYRDKQRASFYHEYTFKAATGEDDRKRGTDWTSFDEIQLASNIQKNISNPLNYDASEKVGAVYIMDKIALTHWEFVVGVRAEHTVQGYNLKYATEGQRNEAEQRYWDILPDVHIKYNVHKDANLRFSYARAINRPSFFEIVPYSILGDDYDERGNPDLKHTVADNFDVRYEWFPAPSEQLMAGIFYKRIQDPIEYGMQQSGQDSYYTPCNFGTAHNMGVEIDITKYFHRFGIKANYTYTYSRIKTDKIVEEANPDPTAENKNITRTVSQTRPLFGQAGHVVNVSLLYKDAAHGWDAQLAFNYTGKRLCSVSRFLDNDSWEDGHAQLDFSAEKKFGATGWSIFVKANNLLNLPLIQYVKANAHNANEPETAARHKGGILERKQWYGQSFLVGVRFKLQ